MDPDLCDRGLHWLADTRITGGGCGRCRSNYNRGNGDQCKNDGVAPAVVDRFRAMFLDGSWRPYTSLVMDDLIDAMAVYLVRNGLSGLVGVEDGFARTDPHSTPTGFLP